MLVAAVILIVAGIAAVAYDRAMAGHALAGVRVADVDVGGMTKVDARRAIAPEVARMLATPLTVHAADRTVTLRPEELGVRVDAGRAARRAVAASQSFSWPSRLYHRFVPADVSVRLPLETGDAEIRSFVERLADDVRRKPVDAAIAASDNGMRLVKQHAVPGRELDVEQGVNLVVKALNRQEPEVTIPTRTVAPATEPLEATITVDLSTNTLTLWDGFRVAHRYPVGTAQKGFRTPAGEWTVVEKERRPDWVNPDPNGWGSDMPRRIPPGPKNPLGLRALHLNAPGIAIHGTPDPETVGDYVSHGCIRMRPEHVERLFGAVPAGTPVLIYGSPPWGTKGGNGIPGV